MSELSKAALEQNKETVNYLLRAPCIVDEPADDGLTGFAIALALKDKDIVNAMLKSNLLNKEEAVFLAQELLKISPGEDSQLRELQIVISDTLKSLEIKIESLPVVEVVDHLKEKQKQFPYVNPDIERLPHYHKNKDWQKTEIHRSLLSNTWVAKFGTIQQMVLGNFCIKGTSTSDDRKWELQGLKLLTCSHKHDRCVRLYADKKILYFHLMRFFALQEYRL